MTAVAARGGLKAIEFMLWHNGVNVSNSYVASAAPDPGSDFTVMLPNPRQQAFPWRLDMRWDEHPWPDWWNFRACLSDSTGGRITPFMLPGMLFRHPWAVYSTLMMPSLAPELPGAFTLGMRLPGPLDFNPDTQ